MSSPRRAFVFTLELQADTRDDLISSLRHIEFMIAADKLTTGVSGGYNSGYTYKLDVDETITHDDYVAALNSYLAAKKVTNE